jgi:hypothetical protein
VSFLEKKNDNTNCYHSTDVININDVDKKYFEELEEVVNKIKGINEEIESPVNTIGQPNESNTTLLSPSESIINKTSTDLTKGVINNGLNNVMSRVKSSTTPKSSESGGNVDETRKGGKSKHIKSYSHSRKHKKNKNKKMRRTSKIIP